MNVYEAVKNTVTTRQAAEYYGIKVTGRGMARCPFHHDRYLGDKLIRETEGIVLWCLEGLHRLVRNGFEFSISDRARKNLEDLMENENNIISFLNSAGYVRRKEGTYASSRRLYAAYRKWCEDNLERPRAENTFKKYLNENAETLGLTYDKNLPGRNGKTVRGFCGIHVEVRTE